AVAAVSAALGRRFSARWGLGVAAPLASRAGFIVLLLTLAVAQFITEPVANAFSRRIEHQADVFGQEAIHGIVADPQRTAVAAFNDLGAAWFEDPDPSPFIVFWSYNHPSIQSRASFAQQYDPCSGENSKAQFFSYSCAIT